MQPQRRIVSAGVGQPMQPQPAPKVDRAISELYQNKFDVHRRQLKDLRDHIEEALSGKDSLSEAAAENVKAVLANANKTIESFKEDRQAWGGWCTAWQVRNKGERSSETPLGRNRLLKRKRLFCTPRAEGICARLGVKLGGNQLWGKQHVDKHHSLWIQSCW